MEDKLYPVTHLTRDDIHSIGFDTLTLSDEDMTFIAQLMGESYCEGNSGFWSDLEYILVNNYKLTQHDI